MKRFFSILLTIVLCVVCLFSLSACKTNKIVKGNSVINPREETIYVGFVDYVPLNYTYRNSFIGFNTELAIMTFNALGYNVEFRAIEPQDENELIPSAEDIYSALEEEYIDCFWGGLTDSVLFDDQRADFSHRYMENSLCIVKNEYNTTVIEDLSDFENKTVAFAKYSSAERFFNSKIANKIEVTPLVNEKSQQSAMHMVLPLNQKADYAIVDSLLALYLTNYGNEYSSCTLNVSNNEEAVPYEFEEKSYIRVVFGKEKDENDQTQPNILRDNVNVMLETFEKIGVLEALANKTKYYFSNQELSLADFLVKDLATFNQN